MKRLENPRINEVEITAGLLFDKQKINREVSLPNVYKRFFETGRFDALKCVFNPKKKPHIFFDSDAAKFIESAGNILMSRRDDELEALCDAMILDIVKNQRDDGYFNSYFQVYEPENIFKKRTEHELYCAGHLIEAAVSYYEATKKDALLVAMRKYADLIERVFRIERSAAFVTGGHEEIELALIKLYLATNEKRYLELAEFFVFERGRVREEVYEFTFNEYDQSHLPLEEQETAEGHCVRALYFYIAAADLARIRGDGKLASVLRRLFDNITQRRMYVTGGVGSTFHGEAFTYDYDLPNASAYAETCASIALAMFANKLALIEHDATFSDVAERAFYNGVLSGVSGDGRAFFYVNPLSASKKAFEFNSRLKTPLNMPLIQRKEVFDCSCCPPNLTRFIAAFSQMLYAYDEKNVYVNHYANSVSEFDGVRIVQKTNYPFGGKIELEITSSVSRRVFLRIPQCATSAAVCVDGRAICARVDNGYVELGAKSGECLRVCVDLDVGVRLASANPLVRADCGRKAVMLGAVVFCAEGVDNDFSLADVVLIESSGRADFENGEPIVWFDGLVRKNCGKLYSFDDCERERVRVRLVPYYSWANRGANDMQVWFLTDGFCCKSR